MSSHRTAADEAIDARIEKIRMDFPILSTKINGKDLIYLDNAATSQKPESVISAISDYYRFHNSNVHRGVHHLSQKATEIYEAARESVRAFINAKSTVEVIFTKGTTESLNLAAHSLNHLLSEGDDLICTEMEHHSNFVPWQVLAKEKKAKFHIARISDAGEFSIAEIEKAITSRTKIIAITHASNTLGTINDIRLICRIAHRKGAIVVVDGAQFIPHGKVDVQNLDCDFYAFSTHKMLGPTGHGVLYGKKEILEKMPPYQYGGGMIGEVKADQTSFGELPFVFEAGTPNVEGAFGLTKAISYIENLGHDFISQYENSLLEYATEKLMVIPGLKIYGTSSNKVPLISFLVGKIHPFDLGIMLDQMGIAVRTGHHCTQPIMARYSISGTVRASFSFYNTHSEIDAFADGIKEAVKILS